MRQVAGHKPLLIDAWVSWRNVVRQGRRTLSAGAAVAFGTAALILAAGFIEWIYVAMREGTIHAGLGHLQIVRAGFAERGMADPFNYLLPAEGAELRGLRATPHVLKVAPRLQFSGLVAFGEKTLSFIGEGRDPDNEVGGPDALIIESGEPLSNGSDGVLLGQGLAANLGAKVGDKLVLLVDRRGGGPGGLDVTVRGVFSTQTKAYDDMSLHVPFRLADQMLEARGAHKWVVYLDDTRNTASVAGLVRPLLGKGMTVVPWYDAADFYKKTVRLFSRQVLVMKVIIALVVILSVSNAMMMAVMERVSEIATAMALGVRRGRLLLRFLLEGVFVGIAGGLIGVVAGYLLSLAVSKIGIPMPPPPGMARGFVGEILVTPQLVLDAAVLAATTALVASAYPAWKASRMVIADALRHGR